MRTSTTAAKRPGPPPLPRLRVNPELYDAVRSCGRPAWQIAVEAGLVHGNVLSKIFHVGTVPASPLWIRRMERVAEAVRFNDQLFVDGDR